MEEKINVIKRNGSSEALNLDKIHKVLIWACSDIKGVSVSEVELKSQLNFFDGITTKEIHATLTKTAAELASEEYPNYQYVASKLLNLKLRKDVYGGIEPHSLLDIVKKNIELGLYTKELLEWYTEDEIKDLDEYLENDRDFNIVYAGMEQWVGKYLVQNRVTKEKYETPQVAYMLIAATAFNAYPKRERLNHVKEYYDQLSLFNITIPTPVLAGLRTTEKQFSSCTGINVDDSLKSIESANAAIIEYVSRKAGIGLNVGRIRALNSPIRGGKAVHTGVTPFLKAFQGALRSCSQGAIRNGSMTTFLCYFHPEIEDQLVLKNNKGSEDNRVRHMDYAFTVNRLLYKRVQEDGMITLFNPSDVPELMKAFYHSDNDAFEKLYEKLEKDQRFKDNKRISAYGLMEKFIEERVNTGRIYLLNIDNANNHGSYDPDIDPIEHSNLCLAGDTLINTNLGLITLKNLYDNQDTFIVASDIRAYDGNEILQKTSYSKKFNGIIGTNFEKSSKVYKTRNNAEVYELQLSNGMSVKATLDHKFMTNTGFKCLKDITENDYVYIQSGTGLFNVNNMLPDVSYSVMYNNHETKEHNLPIVWSEDLAFLLGWLIADGFITKDNLVGFSVGKDDSGMESRLRTILTNYLPNHTITEQIYEGSKQLRVMSKHFIEFLLQLGVTVNKSSYKKIPYVIFNSPKFVQKEFLRALFGADGTVDISKNAQAITISYSSTSLDLIKEIQQLLINFGIKSSYYNNIPERYSLLPDSKRNKKMYKCNKLYSLKIGKSNRNKFMDEIGFIIDRKNNKVIEALNHVNNISDKSRTYRNSTYAEKFMVKVRDVHFAGYEDVYDITVDKSHSFIANGIVTHNCMEILLPSKPMASEINELITINKNEEIDTLLRWNDDKEIVNFKRIEVTDSNSTYEITKNAGRIFLCTLSAINWGNIKKTSDFAKPMEYAIRALDAILSYQNYPLIESETSTRDFRTLGIGINNLAYFLAKHNVKYDDSSLKLVDEYMEAMSYYAIKASVQLAKEFGPAKEWKRTKWGKGQFPWERRSKATDKLVPFNPKMDWEPLRAELLQYGIRNCSLLANMPSESSSQLVGATNGIEPPLAYSSKKRSKDGVFKLIVPEYTKLKNKYDLCWEQKGATGYLKVVSMIGRYCDQATSVNTSYNPEKFDGKLTYDQILSDIFLHYELGGTTLYYHNTYDGATDDYNEDNKNKVEELPLEDIQEADCSACKL